MHHLISKLVFQSRYWILFISLNSNLSTNAQTFVNLESGAFFTAINDIPFNTNVANNKILPESKNCTK